MTGFHVTLRHLAAPRNRHLGWQPQPVSFVLARSVKQKDRSAITMVKTCLIVGCAVHGGRDQRSFYRLPALIENQCEKTKTLSTVAESDIQGGFGRLESHSRKCAVHIL
ncbi:hypothetical protein CHARACLAT_007305 [Characodon lateralis]|uniref:Uncharacterized protein n=1 Tax=Characodon lateralis TaxID=208331 RepID=A0ABU7D7Q9_9TELE|nr:hypothetical protein [Characodon lateralis]